MTAMSQEEVTNKHSVQTNSFWNNWFAQVGADWNAWYGNVEDGQHYSKNPFEKFRSNPGVALAIGKWFTPSLGLRTKLQGIWGKAVFSDDNYGNGNKYWILNEQLLFNLSNMFCGYNSDRVWNLIPFAGAGVGRSCTYSRYAAGFSVGFLNEFNIGGKVILHVEFGWNRYEKEICGMFYDHGKGVMSHPNNVYAEVGVTCNIGRKGWKKTPDIEAMKAMSQSEIDALNAQLEDERAENDRLRDELENKGTTVVNTEAKRVSAPVSVFFNINETTVASSKDIVCVKSLAEYAKENNMKLRVTGYADSATGRDETNFTLSQRRAECVAAELENMGISKDSIIIEVKGGVDTLVPADYNRRVTVEAVYE